MIFYSILFYSHCKNFCDLTKRGLESSVLRIREVYPGIFISDPGSVFYPSRTSDPGSRISDPGSRIQKQEQKSGVKKN